MEASSPADRVVCRLQYTFALTMLGYTAHAIELQSLNALLGKVPLPGVSF